MLYWAFYIVWYCSQNRQLFWFFPPLSLIDWVPFFLSVSCAPLKPCQDDGRYVRVWGGCSLPPKEREGADEGSDCCLRWWVAGSQPFVLPGAGSEGQGLHTNVVKEMQSKAGCKASLVPAVLLLEVAGSTKFGFLYSAKLLKTLRQ